MARKLVNVVWAVASYDASYLHAAIQSDRVLVTDDETLTSIAKKYVETLKSDDL